MTYHATVLAPHPDHGMTGGLSEVPEHLRGYIDFAAIGRDAEIGGDIRAIRSGGSLYVFWNR